MLRRTISALSLGVMALLPSVTAAQSITLSGSYLAARQADADSDFAAAADYFVRALGQDPTNTMLMEQAITAQVSAGLFDNSVSIAKRLAAANPKSQLAAQVLFASGMKKEDYDGVISLITSGYSVGSLVDGLLTAWAELGAGNMKAALAAFDVVKARPGLEAIADFQKALALASVGDFEGADKLFEGDNGAKIQASRRGTVARAEILSQLDRGPEAIKVIRDNYPEGQDPQMDALVARLEKGETLPFELVRSPVDGAAEVFQTVAAALNGEAADAYTLIYARTADYLRPGDTQTILLMAGLLESLGRYELATKVYEEVPKTDPSFYAAEIGRAEAMRHAGDAEGSVKALQDLAAAYPDIELVQQTLGDALRRLERYPEATEAYDKAIALEKNPDDRRTWILYFARGITYERQDKWQNAEADFRKALVLSPDQPQVLNYLGYSMVEKGENLDEALKLIEKAVAARPDDGYITDSLGWAYYRLGRYQDAVAEMEKAVQLTPLDPIVNDHLGDVLWAVGRHLEAQFQWRRALSFKPEEADATRIRRKLEVGLDEVLKEEGAPPLKLAHDG